MSVAKLESSALIQEFLGSVRVLSQTVRITVEEPLLGALSGGGLSFPQYKLLRLVASTDGHSIGEVATILGVSSAAASKGVDKLVRRRFLRRTEAKLDRRAMHLSLTEQGRRAVAAYEEARNTRLLSYFAATPAAGLRRAIALLDNLSASLVDHGADPEELCLQCGIYFPDKCIVRQRGGRRCYLARLRAAKSTAPTLASEAETPVRPAPSRRTTRTRDR
jgi:DNA-binding MarR family transcriptional regulator